MHVKGAGAYGAFAVTQDSSRYTRAETFSTIGMQTLMHARFRRSPTHVVRQKPLDNAARQIAGVSKSILQRQIDNCAKADPADGAGIAAAQVRLASASKQAGRARGAAQTASSVERYPFMGRDSLRCRIFNQDECSNDFHASRRTRQPLCRCVLDAVRRSLQGVRPNGRRGLALGVHERRRETRGMGTHPVRGHGDAFPS